VAERLLSSTENRWILKLAYDMCVLKSVPLLKLFLKAKCPFESSVYNLSD
jgi:hypothetical protein